MDQNTSEPVGNVPQASESFGTLPNHAESFGTVRNDAEAFGKVPNPSESGAFRQPTVTKTENHTMTVREAARAFENAGVARTERSIVNWCQMNRQGVSRLDCYFEENDRKYFITPQSVDRAIKEELAKAREQGVLPNASERATEERHQEPPTSARPASGPAPEGTPGNLRALELENRDLMIASRVKDGIIEQLQKDRERLMTYQETLVKKMVDQSRMIGSLETRLLSLEAPRGERAERNPTVPNTPMLNPSAPEPAVTPEPRPVEYREAQVEHPPSYQG